MLHDLPLRVDQPRVLEEEILHVRLLGHIPLKHLSKLPDHAYPCADDFGHFDRLEDVQLGDEL